MRCTNSWDCTGSSRNAIRLRFGISERSTLSKLSSEPVFWFGSRRQQCRFAEPSTRSHGTCSPFTCVLWMAVPHFRKVRSVMKKLFALQETLLLFPVFALCIVRADAQALESIKSQEELNKVVASLDAALFDSYNRCDLEKFAAFFADDVEFYHDQGGVTLGKDKLTESVRKNICGKVTRELVSSSL